jgi:hypothetical protein
MGGDHMKSRHLFASFLMAYFLTAGFGSLAPTADSASAGQPILKIGKIAGNDVVEIRHRGRGPRLYLPIAPSYLAYDYPYYYSRGHYPTHIGPGYIYYGYPYYYRRGYYSKYGTRCAYANRRCAANWSY